MSRAFHRIAVFVPFLAVAVLAPRIATAQTSLQEGTQVLLRKTYNTSRFVYVEVSNEALVYEHRNTRLFPVPEDLPVVITEVKIRERELEVRFRHASLGEGRIKVETDGQRLTPDGIEAILRSAFKRPGIPDDYLPVVGNAETQVAHFAGSNHLPHEGSRNYFETPEEAAANGWRLCSVCFYTIPRISNFEYERWLGAECAAQARFYYPPVIDTARQTRLDTVAERALANWPLPPRGYTYSFDLVEGDDANAMACPGGRIFVTTALMDAIEDEPELEAILAHEIGHVEMRHGYRQLRKAQQVGMWTAIAAAAAGAAIGEDLGEATTIADLVQILSGVAASIVLSGYSRDYEMEADSTAIGYLQANPRIGDTRALEQVLRKLRYSVEVRGHEVDGGGMFSSHPDIDDRIARAESANAAFFEGVVFQGFDKSGNLVATLEFIMQSISRSDDWQGLEILAGIRTTPALGDKTKVKDIKVHADGRELELDNKEDTEIWPSDVAGLVFVSERSRSLVGQLTGIQLKLRNVSTWRRVPLTEIQ